MTDKQQQIIKHRKGCIDKVVDTTSYLAEIIYGIGNIGDITGNVAFIGNSDATIGGYSPISKIYFGVNAPNINAYKTTLNGLPFYSVYDKTLYILQNPKNIDMDLSGNIYRRNIAPNNISASGFISGNGLNITGDVKLGKDSSNIIEVNGRVKGDWIPIQSKTFNLGTPQLKWKNIYADYISGSFEGDGSKLTDVHTSMSINVEGQSISEFVIILPNDSLNFYTDVNKGLNLIVNSNIIEIAPFNASYAQKGVSYYKENEFIVTDGFVEIDYTFFNEYTSSMDDIIDSIYQYTSSMNIWSGSVSSSLNGLNLFSQSIKNYTSSNNDFTTSLKNYTSSMNIWSQSIINTISDLQLYTSSMNLYTSSMNSWTESNHIWSSSVDANITNLKLFSSSLNTYTSSMNAWTESIYIFSSSIKTWSSSVNVNLANLNSFSASVNNYTSSMNIWTESISTNLNSYISIINTWSASINNYTSSMNIWSGSVSSSLNDLNIFASSVKIWSSSINTYTSSINSWSSSIHSYTASIKTFSASIKTWSSSIHSYTASINTWSSSINSTTGALETFSASIKTWSGAIHSHTSSINTYTSSINAMTKTFIGAINQILLTTSSVYSNNISFPILTNSTVTYKLDDNLRISQSITTREIIAVTSSISGNGTFGGNVQVNGNLNVLGTITATDSSVINVGTNILNLTASIPADGGIYVNNSSTQTGSILWNSVDKYWKAGLKDNEKRIVLQDSNSPLTTNALTFANSDGNLISAQSPSVNSIPFWNGTTWSNFSSQSIVFTSSFNTYTASINTYTGSMLSYTASMNLATSSFYTQNGNSFGANAILGTNDNYSLSFETNNLSRLTITNDGKFLFNDTDIGTGRYQFQGNLVVSNGRIGIGTKFPEYALELYDNYYDEIVLGLQTTQDAYILQLIANYYNATFLGTLAQTTVPFLTNYLPDATVLAAMSSTSPLQLFTNSTARLNIFSDGNVSIGTTNNAGRKLYVSGDIGYSSKLITFSGGGLNGQFLKATSGNDIWANILTSDISGLNSFTSSVNLTTGALETFSSSIKTWSASISASVNALNLFSASIKTWSASINNYTSSINTWSESVNINISNLNSFSSSIKTWSASINNYTSSMNIWSGSVDINLTNLNIFSASVKTWSSSINTYTSSTNSFTSSVKTWSGSINSFTSSVNLTTGALETFSASIKTWSSSIHSYTSSVNLTTGALETFSASIKTWSSSINLTTGALETFSASIKTWSASINTHTSSINLATSSFYTQNGNSFGTNAVLGTNDNYSLSFETNNAVRMHINTSGSVGIGTTDLLGVSLRVFRPISDSISTIGIYNNGVIQSGVINTYYFRSDSNLSNDASVNTLYHYAAIQGSFGAGTLINQFGYTVNDLTGSTNTYGYHSSISSGSGKWALYMGGTANNHMGGRLGIGSVSLPERNLYLALPISGASIAHGFYNASSIQTNLTTAYYNTTQFVSSVGTSISTIIGYTIFEQSHNGTVSNQYGILINDLNKGSVINAAYRSVLSAASNKWNIYIDGTANNYLNGNLGVGISTPIDKLSVVGAINYTTTLKINGNTGANGQFLKTTGTTNTWSDIITTDISGLNSFTSSINSTTGALETFSSSVKTWSASINASNNDIVNNLTNLNSFSASVKTWSASINLHTASMLSYTSSMNIWSGSVSSSLNGLNLFSASIKTWSASINTYTSSINTVTGSIYSHTSSVNLVTSSFFRQNGNSFGANAVLGTNDNFNLSFETNGVIRASISSSGKFIIGTVGTPSGLLNVGGDILATGDIAAYSTSDMRLKKDIVKIKDSLNKIDKINGYTYKWNNSQSIYAENKSDLGVIAQEIERIFPEIVSENYKGYKSIKYDRLIAVLIEGIKELNQEIKYLKNRV